jgi:hypothetical protein
MSSRIDSDLTVNGNLSATSMTLASGSVSNATVASNAAIDVTKVEHLLVLVTDFGLDLGSPPTADKNVILYTATNGATVRSVKATLMDTGQTTDIKFSVARNFVSNTMLSATIDFTHADTDKGIKTGSLSATALTAGDLLIGCMDFVTNTSSLALGPVLQVEVDQVAV